MRPANFSHMARSSSLGTAVCTVLTSGETGHSIEKNVAAGRFALHGGTRESDSSRVKSPEVERAYERHGPMADVFELRPGGLPRGAVAPSQTARPPPRGRD